MVEGSFEAHSHTEYYIDITTNRVLLGRSALNLHIELGGSLVNVYSLCTALTDESLELPTIKQRSPGRDLNDEWLTNTDDDYLRWGKWILEVIRPADGQKPIALNEKIIRRARNLGLGPSPDQIGAPKRFGSSANFYAQLEEPRTHRRNTFSEMTDSDLLGLLLETSQRLGKVPTWSEAEEISRSDIRFPYPKHYVKRFGSWTKAISLAGFNNPDHFSYDDQNTSDLRIFRWLTASQNGIAQDFVYFQPEDDGKDVGPNRRTRKEKGPKANYYYDLLDRKLIIGQAALEDYLASRPIESPELYKLEDLLITNTIDRLGIKRTKKREAGQWSKKECLECGKWLVGLLKPHLEKKILTIDILTRAYILGLAPSYHQIIHPDRFGSFVAFCKDLNLPEASRRTLFKDVQSRRLIADLRALGRNLGRKPTEKDVRQRRRKNARYASESVYADRFGSLRNALEKAGWPNIYAMGRSDHIDYGVKFMFANDGIRPSQKAWDYLSRLKRGPSASNTRHQFRGGFSGFKAIVIKEYQKQKTQREADQKQKIDDINQAVAKKEIPSELFEEGLSESEIIKRYAKYIVVHDIVHQASEARKVEAATNGTPDNFVSKARRLDQTISAGYLEYTASSLGVFDDIWPMDGYMQDLHLPDDFFRRQPLRITN